MKPRRGRPPLDPDDPSVKVSISLPTQAFDRLCALAHEQDQSLPEVIRRAIYGNAWTIKTRKNRRDA